jgi:hypothetical protein
MSPGYSRQASSDTAMLRWCRSIAGTSLEIDGEMRLLHNPLIAKSDELVIKVDHFHQTFDGHPLVDCMHVCTSRVMASTEGRPSVYLRTLDVGKSSCLTGPRMNRSECRIYLQAPNSTECQYYLII